MHVAVRRCFITVVAVVCVAGTVGLSLHRDSMVHAQSNFVPAKSPYNCISNISLCPTCSNTPAGDLPVYTTGGSPGGYFLGDCTFTSVLNPFPSCSAFLGVNCGYTFRCIGSEYIGPNSAFSNDFCNNGY